MHPFRRPVLIATIVLGAFLRQADAQDAAAAAPPVFKPEEIDQMIAPIALYPDSLLAQIFMASTYPLEIVEADRWVKANPKVTGKALEDAMQKQSWDPAVKSLTAFPPVLAMMSEKLDVTQKLGDAFLAQQQDVMAAVQRLRAKANAEGNLKTTKEQKVIVEPAPPPDVNVNVQQAPPADVNVNVEQPPAQQTIIKIEPADPQVVYVPQYNPSTAYGAWPYPSYPPYPYYPPGYMATASLLSFGVGMAAGAALWGNCNWGGGWGNNDVDIDVNNYNNFNKTDIKNGNWQHNSEHRKGVGYRDQKTQQKYGRGQGQNAKSREQFRGRAEQGRQQLARGDADKARREMERGRGDRGQDRGRQDGVGQDRGRQQDRARQQDRGRQDSARRDAGQRSGARAPDRKPAQRPSTSRSRPASAGSRGGAFEGAGSGGRQQARQHSNRGQSSRQSARSSGFSGGGGRGGGGMRGGGGGGGGGRRGGGGGGRRR